MQQQRSLGSTGVGANSYSHLPTMPTVDQQQSRRNMGKSQPSCRPLSAQRRAKPAPPPIKDLEMMGTTDEKGRVIFKDVPLGRFEVYVKANSDFQEAMKVTDMFDESPQQHMQAFNVYIPMHPQKVSHAMVTLKKGEDKVSNMEVKALLMKLSDDEEEEIEDFDFEFHINNLNDL